jgi:hypothetical protein
MEDKSLEELPIDADFLDASISPDGEWIAYSSNRSGAREVYVERFPALSDRRLVSNAGGQQPLWSNDGRELYYLDTDRSRVMLVAVSKDGGLELDRPEILVERPLIELRSSDPGHSYDVAPDGRLLMLTPGTDDRHGGEWRGEAEAETVEVTVVLNWFAELERLVPTRN